MASAAVRFSSSFHVRTHVFRLSLPRAGVRDAPDGDEQLSFFPAVSGDGVRRTTFDGVSQASLQACSLQHDGFGGTLASVHGTQPCRTDAGALRGRLRSREGRRRCARKKTRQNEHDVVVVYASICWDPFLFKVPFRCECEPGGPPKRKGKEAHRDQPDNRNPWERVRLPAWILLRCAEEGSVLRQISSTAQGRREAVDCTVYRRGLTIVESWILVARWTVFGFVGSGSIHVGRDRVSLDRTGCGNASHPRCVWMPSHADREGFFRKARSRRGCDCFLGGCGNGRVLATTWKSHQTTSGRFACAKKRIAEAKRRSTR